jgi:hypothetical protein
MRQNPTRRPTRAVAQILALCLVLTGCASVSQSKYNPFNWFKSSTSSEPVTLYVPPADKRPLVAQVLTLKVEQTPDGAIVRATGLPPTQGWWKAALVKVAQDDLTKLVFEFRLFPPLTPTPAGTPLSREITVATSVSNLQLDGIKTITVQGEGNALSSRR